MMGADRYSVERIALLTRSVRGNLVLLLPEKHSCGIIAANTSNSDDNPDRWD